MSYKMGFNKYEIKGDYAVIYLDKKNGEIFECFVDLDTLQNLIDLGWHWTASYGTTSHNYYVTHTQDGKTYLMHRFITDTREGDGTRVDHRNHNTLDNRHQNLRVTDNVTNMRNRRGANKNNKSGFRNVAFVGGWWIVQFRKDKKNIIAAKSRDRVEAGRLADELRPLYYGE